MKALMWILGILLLPIGLLLLYLWIEDKKYTPYRYGTPKEEKRKGLLLTWESEEANLWEQFSAYILPGLKQKHAQGEVTWVLPFAHKPLNHPDKPGRWTHCVVVLFEKNVNSDSLSTEILKNNLNSPLATNLRSADLMKLQKGLDMFYPASNGSNRESGIQNTIEYVFSDKETRQQYYEDQYLWSGPAMADLHSRDKAARFIGFEVEKRLFNSENMPEWDLLHVVGFTRWQMIKAIPFFLGTWNKHAERAFGRGMTFKKKLAEWDKIRMNVKSAAKQNMDLSWPKADD